MDLAGDQIALLHQGGKRHRQGDQAGHANAHKQVGAHK